MRGDGWEVRGFEPPLPGLVDRIWRRDPTTWAPGEDDPAERLGWLDLPEDMAGEVARLESFAADVRGSGVERVILLGMGGSSLAPEMLAATFGPSDGYPDLEVLDSTHPAHVSWVEARLDPDRTLFLVSSKSGTTVETLSLYHRFRSLVGSGDRFVAITDPGSPLEELAGQEGFRAVFTARPDVGGRYSALSHFGLVPAALLGIRLDDLLSSARAMARATGSGVPEDRNPAAVIGAAIGALAREGRDKLTFLVSEPIGAFGDWVEQLLAESTGKRGTGIVPVVGEPVVAPARYGPDRAFVLVRLAGDRSMDAFMEALEAAGHPVVAVEVPSIIELGGEVFRWELATAVAGAVLEVNPFDQPDVESAKRAARRALEEPEEASWEDRDPEELFADVRPSEYAGLLAFAPPTREAAATLTAARRRLVLERGVATSAAFGPRYLHSSGQLHKGGPKGLRALVVLDPPREEVPIPGAPHGFARLVRAQAAGDAEALESSGRRVLRTTWGAFEAWTQG